MLGKFYTFLNVILTVSYAEQELDLADDKQVVTRKLQFDSGFKDPQDELDDSLFD